MFFPPPLTVPQRVARSARFWAAIGPVIAAYSQTALFFSTLGRATPREQREATWAELHEWGSDLVAGVINALRGFYTKSGQLIGSRPDLFPEPFCRKLAKLQDSVPPMPPELVAAVVATELLGGKPRGGMRQSKQTRIEST